jgi:hypothetical protein
MRLLDGVHADACLSPDGEYRYWLSRVWDRGSELALWVMLNPSTASVEVDDPAARRTQEFSRRWGYGGVIIVNLFARRCTRPVHLKDPGDPVGPENDDWLWGFGGNRQIGLVVTAWGVHGTLHGRDQKVARMYRLRDRPLYCLGTTKDGHPRHPLYLKGNTPLEPWPSPTVDVEGAA